MVARVRTKMTDLGTRVEGSRSMGTRVLNRGTTGKKVEMVKGKGRETGLTVTEAAKRSPDLGPEIVRDHIRQQGTQRSPYAPGGAGMTTPIVRALPNSYAADW